VSFFKRVQEALGAKKAELTPSEPAARAAEPTPRAPQSSPGAAAGPQKTGALEAVRHIIAVGSGKGGVGKSTVSLNLALALQQMGKKVGLVDADVHGPSQQHMTNAERPRFQEGDLLEPSTYQGLKLISVAMFSSTGQAQLMRGPMAAQVLRQFLTQVAWGELDYLIIDLPPGTGGATPETSDWNSSSFSLVPQRRVCSTQCGIYCPLLFQLTRIISFPKVHSFK